MKKILLIVIFTPFILLETGAKKIYHYVFKEATYMAIRQANNRRKLTGYKQVVMKVGGWPRIYRRAEIKYLYQRGTFKKGMSLDEVLSKALYITT